MRVRKILRPVFWAAAVLTLSVANVFAAYPDKSVKVVVSFPPGGATDVVTRILTAELGKLWKQTVIVENKTGAGGNIGAAYVAKSAPDGYTLLMSSPAEVAINPFLYPSMPYDAQKDLAPVVKVGSAPLVLTVNPAVPAKTVQELIQYIKNNPGKVNYASSGTGGPQHLAGEQFKMLTKLNVTHVPYKGGAPAITDLLSGQVQMFFAGLPPAMQFIKVHKLRALAVTTSQRSALVPDIPTMSESGVPGFNIENWQGLFAPANTPAPVVDKIARDVAQVLGLQAIREKLAAQGISADPIFGREFAGFINAEREKYRAIIKSAHVTIN